MKVGLGKLLFLVSFICIKQAEKQINKKILPDSFGATVKMEDGYKLRDILDKLQVINGIIQVSLPLFVKVDQSRST